MRVWWALGPVHTTCELPAKKPRQPQASLAATRSWRGAWNRSSLRMARAHSVDTLTLASRTVRVHFYCLKSLPPPMKRWVEGLSVRNRAKVTQQLRAEPGLVEEFLSVVRTMRSGAAGETCHQMWFPSCRLCSTWQMTPAPASSAP